MKNALDHSGHFGYPLAPWFGHTEDAPEVIDACMAAGASGDLMKWTAGKDLIKAVETVRRGLTYVPDRRAG